MLVVTLRDAAGARVARVAAEYPWTADDLAADMIRGLEAGTVTIEETDSRGRFPSVLRRIEVCRFRSCVSGTHYQNLLILTRVCSNAEKGGKENGTECGLQRAERSCIGPLGRGPRARQGSGVRRRIDGRLGLAGGSFDPVGIRAHRGARKGPHAGH